MRWSETVASTCRYADVIGKIFEEADIVWENCVTRRPGRLGHANILAAMPNGTFIHYAWSYGSCNVCDPWESAGFSKKDILKDVKRRMFVLPTFKAAKNYFKNIPKAKAALNAWPLKRG
jgi:hypothetical protein